MSPKHYSVEELIEYVDTMDFTLRKILLTLERMEERQRQPTEITLRVPGYLDLVTNGQPAAALTGSSEQP